MFEDHNPTSREAGHASEDDVREAGKALAAERERSLTGMEKAQHELDKFLVLIAGGALLSLVAYLREPQSLLLWGLLVLAGVLQLGAIVSVVMSFVAANTAWNTYDRGNAAAYEAIRDPGHEGKRAAYEKLDEEYRTQREKVERWNRHARRLFLVGIACMAVGVAIETFPAKHSGVQGNEREKDALTVEERRTDASEGDNVGPWPRRHTSQSAAGCTTASAASETEGADTLEVRQESR